MGALATLDRSCVYELQEEELVEIRGGFGIVEMVAIWGFAYVIGQAIGEAYTHYEETKEEFSFGGGETGGKGAGRSF